VTRQALSTLLVVAMAFPLIMIPVAPLIAYAVHPNGFPAWQAHTSLLVPEVDKLWREATSRPLMNVCGDAGLSFGVAFYSDARPMVCDNVGALGSLERNDKIAREGVAVVCFESAACSAALDRLGAGTRRTLELSRTFMGVEGPRERYLIAAIPPQK
jgi:hypothetical protein